MLRSNETWKGSWIMDHGDSLGPTIMKRKITACRLRPILVLLSSLTAAVCARSASEGLKQGDVIKMGGRTVTVRRLEALPLVESEYSKRFKFDSFDNPRLKELRERHGLDAVVKPGRDEFEKQVLLMDWTHRQFKRFGRPSTNCHGAIEILGAIGDGHRFFCAQYAEVLVSAAASLGWVDRSLALRRHQGVNKNGGSTEHTVTEMWSNQHRKWVMFDPTSNMVLETNGVPLNAWEIRQEWFYRGGSNLVFRVGREGRRYRKANLPIVLGKYADFGNLTVDPDELDKYGFIGYIPNTDLMDSGYDYGRMFITKDALCEGTKWHVRTLPANPEVDPYFPIDQAALALAAKEGNLHVALRTWTPNFARYELRIDRGGWSETGDNFVWDVHPGRNRLEARAVNQFGVKGPVSTAELDVKE